VEHGAHFLILYYPSSELYSLKILYYPSALTAYTGDLSILPRFLLLARTHARTYRYTVVHHYRYTRVHHFRYGQR
jgi:hypothetical protein